MLKITYAGCLGLSRGFSSQFTLEMCAAAKNCEQFNKTPLFGVQGRLRSSMSTNLKSLSLVLVMICSKFVPICNRFHAIKANFWQNNVFLRGVPLFDALVRGEPPHPGARNFVTKNYGPWGSPQWRFCYPGLHHFDTDHECDRQTDGHTDRWTPRRWLRRTMPSAIARKKTE